MGGALAAAYAVSRPERVRALVLSAPAVHPALAPAWQATAARALARVAPRAGVAKVDPSFLSHDPSVVKAYVDDPLVWHGKVPARTALAMYDAGRRVFSGGECLRLPVLLLHGEDDRIVPIESTRRLAALLAGPDKQMVTFPGFFHEVHQETDKQAAIGAVLTWLARHDRPVGD
jgi:alpha-beta hydrolase superfamily lysophospholipase